jgi:hypothetical protein
MKYSYLVPLIVGIILLFVSQAWADSSGPNSPDSAADEGDWNNPTNVFSSDDSRADHSGTNQHILKAYTFNFSISGTIDGFYVEVEGYCDEPNPTRREINIALAKSGYTPEGSWKLDTLSYTSGSETYIDLGGPGDLWSGSWSASDVNSADFSVLIRDDDATGNTLYIDHVRITVFYTPSGGGGDTSYTRRRKLSLED